MTPRYFWLGRGEPVPILPVSVAEMDVMYSGHPNYFGWPVYDCEDGRIFPQRWPTGCKILQEVEFEWIPAPAEEKS